MFYLLYAIAAIFIAAIFRAYCVKSRKRNERNSYEAGYTEASQLLDKWGDDIEWIEMSPIKDLLPYDKGVQAAISDYNSGRCSPAYHIECRHTKDCDCPVFCVEFKNANN